MAKPKSSKITMDQVMAWAREDVNTWEPRSARMRQEQSIFWLENASKLQRGEEEVVPNDPAIITDKAARILARMDLRVQITPRDPSNAERAQKLENMARQLKEQWTRQWGRGLHADLGYEQAKYLIQRGWVCSRITLNTDDNDDDPISYSLWDAANVYPHEVGGKVVRVTHRYKARKSSLVQDSALSQAEEALSTLSDHGLVWVYSMYVLQAGKWWHMVWGGEGSGTDVAKDGEWLKAPVEIGYNPWVISIAVGTPWRATDWDETEYISHIGESFFTPMMGMYKQQKKMMTMLATIIATMANPPTALFLDDGGRVEASEVKMKPGSRMVFPKGKIEQYRLGPGLQDIVAYWQMLQDRQNKASFSSASFGDQVGIESGYMAESLKSGNADVMFPYTQGMLAHWRELLERSFQILANHWPGQMDVFIKQSVNRPAGWDTVEARDIIEERPFVDVSFSNQSLQERVQLGNLAAMLTREHIISPETARDTEFMNIDDPFLEEQRVMAALVKTDPNMIKAMIPISLAFLGMNLEKQLYGTMHGQEIAQLLMMGMMGGQAPGMPPGAAPGMNGVAMPPGMATGMPTRDDMGAPGGVMPGGAAVGGGGQGGVPPTPGGMPMQLPML